MVRSPPNGDEPVWEHAEYDEDDVIDGVPHLTAIMYAKETPYKLHLIALLEEYGWDVETEVWADGMEGRVDLIAEHPAVGCVGIEVKRTRNYTGRTIASGIAQLLNYRSYSYSDYDVDYWALAPGFDVGHTLNNSRNYKEVVNMFRRTIAELKFGMISRRREAISFGKQLKWSIPLRDPESMSEADLTTINEKIADRTWDASEYDPR